MPAEREWYIVRRWQEYEGEGRANLLRLVGIGAFYIIHLANFHQAGLGFLGFTAPRHEAAFHHSVTALAVAWTMVALGELVCLKRQIFPYWLKYVSTSCDVVLLTAILYVADGPRSPLIVGYFLIVILAALRLSVSLVRMATVAVMAGYICLLGCAKWPQTFGKSDVDLTVPRYEQLIVLVALALSGIMLGQILRRVRRLANDFAGRLERAGRGQP